MSMAQTLVQITLEELESLENWEPQLLQAVDWARDLFFRETLSGYTSVMAIRLPATVCHDVGDWAEKAPQAIRRIGRGGDHRAGGDRWRTAGEPDSRR